MWEFVDMIKERCATGWKHTRGYMKRNLRPSCFSTNNDRVKISKAKFEELYLIIPDRPILGSGAYGVVKEVRRISDGKKFAAKIMWKSFKKCDVKNNDFRLAKVKNVRREVQLMQEMDHPNILKCIDYFEQGNRLIVVAELCMSDVSQIINSLGPLNEQTAAKILLEIAKGICYMHRQGVVHRDIKNPNILLTENYDVKIGDFGFSRRAANLHDMKFYDPACGTRTHAAPELWHFGAGTREHYGLKVDCWALGVAFYQMLSGEVPFDLRDWGANIYKPICNVQGLTWRFKGDHFQNVSHQSKAIISKLLTRSCQHRPSGEYLTELLKEYVSSLESESECSPASSSGSTIDSRFPSMH